MLNQCDGCRRGIPILNGLHDLTGSLGSYDGERMACTKGRYVSKVLSCLMSEELDEEFGDV